MKTLRELWEKNGRTPFWAEDRHSEEFYCLSITPLGDAIGWNNRGVSMFYQGHLPRWDFKGARCKCNVVQLTIVSRGKIKILKGEK